MPIPKALKQYQQVDVQTAVAEASPHRLVQMTMEAIQDSLSRAKGHIERKEIGPKGEQISRAIACVNSLRDSLNMEAGKELSANLDRLYAYIERRLLEANIHSSVAMIDEVLALLKPVKEGWDSIADKPEATGSTAPGVSP